MAFVSTPELSPKLRRFSLWELNFSDNTPCCVPYSDVECGYIIEGQDRAQSKWSERIRQRKGKRIKIFRIWRFSVFQLSGLLKDEDGHFFNWYSRFLKLSPLAQSRHFIGSSQPKRQWKTEGIEIKGSYKEINTTRKITNARCKSSFQAGLFIYVPAQAFAFDLTCRMFKCKQWLEAVSRGRAFVKVSLHKLKCHSMTKVQSYMSATIHPNICPGISSRAACSFKLLMHHV